MTEDAILEWHKNQVRSKRLDLLNQTDWTQLTSGNPLSTTKKNAWKSYRQKLRDLPATIIELNDSKGIDVVWPDPPA